MNQFLIRGTSTARRVRPVRMLNGLGAKLRVMPLLVFSVKSGAELRNGDTALGREKEFNSSSDMTSTVKERKVQEFQ